jgi:hypothetical protein
VGNKNALRHGRYTAEAVASRRRLSELIRRSRVLIAQIEEERQASRPLGAGQFAGPPTKLDGSADRGHPPSSGDIFSVFFPYGRGNDQEN